MTKLLTAEALFELSEFEFKDVFTGSMYVWEGIRNVLTYSELILKDKKNLIGVNSYVDSSCKIDGKLICGSNCFIADSTLIRGICILGDGVKIGHGVELKNSIIMNNSSVAHLNYIGDGIIGNNVNVGGGVIMANWRFDKQNITVKFKGKLIGTEMDKFSAAIGDGCSVGVNSVINPGTILGKNSIVFPLVSVSGVFESGSVVK